MGPTLLNIVCICGVRVAWVLFVFPYLEQNLISLYVVFPISWFCSAIAQVISYYKARNKKMLLALREKQTAENT